MNILVFEEVKKFLYEYIGEEWLTNNSVEITPELKFKDLNFDIVDEIITIFYIKEKYNIQIPPNIDGWFDNINDLGDYLNDLIKDDHFRNRWYSSLDKFNESGIEQLVETIKKDNPNSILDVGCGGNEFKKYFPDIHLFIGIDPANHNADIPVRIEDYTGAPDSFDVILALGSINFGNYDVIKKQLGLIIMMSRPGGKIYIRLNPGIQSKETPELTHFDWSDKIHEYAEEFNLITSQVITDFGGRLFFSYTKQ